LNFRYLFRYLLLGFPSALGSSQRQKRAKKWAKMLSKALKNPQSKSHVAVVRNLNNVVVNNHEALANKGFARVFNFLKKSIYYKK